MEISTPLRVTLVLIFSAIYELIFVETQVCTLGSLKIKYTETGSITTITALIINILIHFLIVVGIYVVLQKLELIYLL